MEERFAICRKGDDDADPLQVGKPLSELRKRQINVIGKYLRLEPGRMPLGDAVVVGTCPESGEGEARFPRHHGKLLVAPEFGLQYP